MLNKEEQNKNQMANLKETANAYQPKKTRNIAELEVVNLETMNVEVRNGTDQNGKDFTYSVITVNNEEFRVPDSVLGNIKTILSVKPNLKTIRVLKKGQGMQTEYNVIPLD